MASNCADSSSRYLNTQCLTLPDMSSKFFKPLDDVLRCRICDEYFNICMVTKCNHNYCSLCIRRSMSFKAQCPICFQAASEQELRNNEIIDDVLRAYLKLRETLQNPSSIARETPSVPSPVPTRIKEEPLSDDSYSHNVNEKTVSTDIDKDDPLVARNKARQAEETSDLVTDNQTEAAMSLKGKKRRRKKVKRLISESDSDSELEQRSLKNKNNTEDNEKLIEDPRALFPNNFVPDKTNAFEDLTELFQSDLEVQQELVELSNLTCFQKGSSLTAYQTKVLSLLTTIKEQNNEIMNILRQYANATSSDEVINFPVELPLEENDDCLIMDEYLQNDSNFSLMCKYLSSFGGGNVSSSTNRILKQVFSDELASQYSYRGQKQKKSFEGLTIKAAVIRSVRRNHRNVLEKEIEDCIKVWLKNAPTRVKKQLLHLSK